MKKDLNIEEQKVRMVKVKKPRFDMGGLVDNPTMPKRGKWLSAIGWVPSDDKNWMPVKLRAMKDAAVDVKDSNPLASEEPMFSSSRW